MKINKEDIITVDYKDFDIAAQKLKPVVYRDGDAVCCLSGTDPVEGVFGCGDNVADAISDWKDTLILKLDESPRYDIDAQAVRRELGIPDKPVSDHIKEWNAQFRPAAPRKR